VVNKNIRGLFNSKALQLHFIWSKDDKVRAIPIDKKEELEYALSNSMKECDSHFIGIKISDNDEID
jgi:hypothetical protein